MSDDKFRLRLKIICQFRFPGQVMRGAGQCQSDKLLNWCLLEMIRFITEAMAYCHQDSRGAKKPFLGFYDFLGILGAAPKVAS